MNLFSVFKSSLLLTLTTSLLVSPTFCQSEGKKLFNHVHAWLPSDVEVVYVSNRPFQGLSFANLPVIAHYAKLASIAATRTNDQEPSFRGLMNIKVGSGLYVGRGFRQIKPEGGLGLNGRPEGCSFLLSSQAEIATALRPALANPIKSLYGITFYRLGSPDPDSNLLAASAPEPDLLMVCNDLHLAGEILERKSGRSTSIAFVPHDFLWKWIDVDAPAWGIRSFASTQQNPTSPLSHVIGVVQNYKDPGAVAMTFVLQSDSVATVTYVTRSHDAAREYEQAWHLPSTVLSENNNQVIRMHFDPSDDNMLGTLLPTLLGLIIAV